MAGLSARWANSPDEVADRCLVELGWLLVVVAAGRLRPGLRRAGDAGEFVQHPVHVRGGVSVGVRADQQDPGFVAEERDDDPIVAAQARTGSGADRRR